MLNIDDIEYIEIYGHQIRIIVAGADPLECYGSLSVLENSFLILFLCVLIKVTL